VYDAIVVGAGPGGATAAARMAQRGLRVVLLDRATFPRDKVCGDAISKKAVDLLHRLGLAERVVQANSLGSYGVSLTGTYGHTLAMTFHHQLDQPVPPSFVCARSDFDQVLFDYAVESGAEVRQGVEVQDLLWEGEQVAGVQVKKQKNSSPGQEGWPQAGVVESTPGGEWLKSRLVIGADGANSAVARSLGIAQLDERHYCAGVRAYYDGVTGFHEHRHLEVHFLDEVLPGYFWIFPMAGGRANVGVGMLSRTVKQRGIKLKALLEACVQHPSLRHRFSRAERVGPIKGWGLPLGSKPRRMAGNGWMLVGDAASLIDPFAGEGIGNAMFSGMQAAEWAGKAVAAGDYSADYLKGYEHTILQQLRGELRLSYTMQRLGRWKWLLNTAIRKVSQSEVLTRSVTLAFDNEAERRKLVTPSFCLRLLAS
jgi:menaquinone-9 beta-reductase